MQSKLLQKTSKLVPAEQVQQGDLYRGTTRTFRVRNVRHENGSVHIEGDGGNAVQHPTGTPVSVNRSALTA